MALSGVRPYPCRQGGSEKVSRLPASAGVFRNSLRQILTVSAIGEPGASEVAPGFVCGDDYFCSGLLSVTSISTGLLSSE